MDCKQTAQLILDHVGGPENIRSAEHCFTRLRLVLRDPGLADKAAVERIEDVLQVLNTGEQFQIVLAGRLNNTYDEFIRLAASKEGKKGRELSDKSSLGEKIAHTIYSIFTPAVPVLAAAGLIKSLLHAAGALGWINSSGSTYVILFSAASIIFYFLPVFLAYTTAKVVRCSKILAMVLGAFLCYPQIESLILNVSEKSTIFGFPVIKTAFTIGDATGTFDYTESVVPIILSVFVLGFLEKALKKIIPEKFQVILVPGLSLIIMLPVMLTVVGPVGEYIGFGVNLLYDSIMKVSPALGGAFVGGFWSLMIIFGAHRALLPVGMNETEVSTAFHQCGAGHNSLLCYVSSANFAQAGAALGVMLKTKSMELKQIAAAAAVPAFLTGFAEPAIYCCCLRFIRPMLCSVIAGALGGAVMGIGGASSHGFMNNGILSITGFFCPDNAHGMITVYLIGIAVSFFGAALLTYFFGFVEKDELKIRN